MFSGGQKLEGEIFRLFKENKVNIASAITRPYPFLMILQDQGFLSEKMHKDFQDACANMVAATEVAYKALSELEKTFNGTVLDVLFSKGNLKAYPDLLEIFEDFQKVILHSFHGHISDDDNSEEMLQLQSSGERANIWRPVEFPECPSDGEQRSTRGEDSSHSASEAGIQETENEQVHPSDQTAPCGHAPRQRNLSKELESVPILQPYTGEAAHGHYPFQRNDAKEFESMPISQPYTGEDSDPFLYQLSGQAPLNAHVEREFCPITQRPGTPSLYLRASQERQTPPRTDDGSDSEDLSSLLLSIEEVSWRFASLQIEDEDEDEIFRLLICDEKEFDEEEHLQVEKRAEPENFVSDPQPCEDQEPGGQDPLSVDKERDSETFDNSSPSCNGQEFNGGEPLLTDEGPLLTDEGLLLTDEGPLLTDEEESEEPAHSPLQCHRPGDNVISYSNTDNFLHGDGPTEFDEQEPVPTNKEGESEMSAFGSLRSDGLGPELPAEGIEECSCVLCSPWFVPGRPEGRTESHQAGAVNLGDNSAVEKPRWKRKRKKGHNWTRIKRKRPNSTQTDHAQAAGQVTSSGRKIQRRCKHGAQGRGQRKYRCEYVNFCSPRLPVTCGELKGTLHKDKLKRGVECIQCEDGGWLTPREFEVRAGHGRTKNWKISVRSGKKTLRWLIQRKFLPHPTRMKYKRKKITEGESHTFDHDLRNTFECELCRCGGALYCCDTCSRSFHKDCHIPPVETHRDPWSCIFCTVEECPRTQHCHEESEVLERQLKCEEQSKCEFLLFKTYCHSESSFFKNLPSYMKEASRNLKEPMWLDKIKKRLREQHYTHLKGFVKDMRLIFQNHRSLSSKYGLFGSLGLRLEEDFEKTFKDIFGIQSLPPPMASHGWDLTPPTLDPAFAVSHHYWNLEPADTRLLTTH